MSEEKEKEKIIIIGSGVNATLSELRAMLQSQTASDHSDLHIIVQGEPDNSKNAEIARLMEVMKPNQIVVLGGQVPEKSIEELFNLVAPKPLELSILAAMDAKLNEVFAEVLNDMPRVKKHRHKEFKKVKTSKAHNSWAKNYHRNRH